ncbi:MAG: DUF1207 domain-containing protein [Ignavibacteriaceae bacterium]|jgi:hypothetical protein|nr:DUF1207 domain-containing protein [Ignavibacteriaceae bacterium]
MRINKIITITAFLVIVLLRINLNGQGHYELFPESLNILPYKANFLEPRMGFQFRALENDLRLDIGHSKDLIKYISDGGISFSFGADFFTFTKLRGEPDFHFPVDAVDYLFGVNFGAKKNILSGEIGARLRISHISAHFVDGHFDPTNEKWRDGRKPIVYSREFVEFIPYYKIYYARFYAGITYLFHVVPEDIGKTIIHAGMEYYLISLSSGFLHPVLAYDFKLVDIGVQSGTNSLSAGFKLGQIDREGVTILYNFYSGYSAHGEYYNVFENYSGININVEF